LIILTVLGCGAPAIDGDLGSQASPYPADLWLRLAGDQKADQSWAVEMDAEANIYWGTFQQTPGELFTDLVIYKIDRNGMMAWETRWGGDFQEKLFVMTVSPPYLFVAGEQDLSMDITQSDMLVLALSLETGEVVWDFTYDQGFGYEEVDGLVADGDHLYVSGWTTSEEMGNDVGLLKLDRQGNLIWAQAWGDAGWDQADGQMVVDEEFIYITGRYDGDNFLLGGYGLLAKFRKDSGECVQYHIWNDSQFYDGYGMTSDGHYLYVTGLTLVRDGLSLNGQIFVQKWDKALELQWERQWGGDEGDQARAIGVDDDGHVIVAGNALVDGNRQIVLLVYNGEGVLLGETQWGGSDEEAVHGLFIDGEYALLAGETKTFGAGMNDALLIRAHIPSGSFPSEP
jgi:outer membrane protein assembly factor BamB